MLVVKLLYDSDAVPFFRPWMLKAAAVVNVGPVMIAEESNLDTMGPKKVLKVFMYHKRIALEVVLCPVELFRVSNLLTFEVRNVKVD